MKIKAIYFLSYFILTEYIIINNDYILKGSVKCIDKNLYTTCIFKNIYYINNKWILYTNYINYFNYCINAYAKKLGKCWSINIISFKKYNNLKYHVHKIFNSISIPFRLTYKNNYGHAFWDDLYSIYTSVVKLGYKNEKFNLIINENYENTKYLDDILSVLQKFSKGKNIFLNKLNKKKLLFKRLIVGSSRQCQRCVTLDYSLKYSRKYNITKLIRDRMYEVFNVKQQLSYPIKGIIVHNKRYSQYEADLLKSVINHFNYNNKIKLYYIDYKNISSFHEQLKLMSKIHIYISGPGTGLLNFPFMADPGVIIHLGHIHFGCPQYLEQYILEGSPHFKAIYYSPQMRMKKLKFSYIIKLVNKAAKLIIKNNIFYVNRGENLNEIGKLYVQICKDHKEVCEKLIHEYDWGYGKCRGIWAENLIYFPSLYIKVPELKKIVGSYNKSINLGCKVGINHSKQKQCIN